MINAGTDFFDELRGIRAKIGTVKKDGTPFSHDDYEKERDALKVKYSKDIPQLQVEGGKLVC